MPQSKLGTKTQPESSLELGDSSPLLPLMNTQLWTSKLSTRCSNIYQGSLALLCMQLTI